MLFALHSYPQASQSHRSTELAATCPLWECDMVIINDPFLSIKSAPNPGTNLNFHTEDELKIENKRPVAFFHLSWYFCCKIARKNVQTPVCLAHCAYKTYFSRAPRKAGLSTFLSWSLDLALWLKRLSGMNYIYLAILTLVSSWVCPVEGTGKGERWFLSCPLPVNVSISASTHSSCQKPAPTTSSLWKQLALPQKERLPFHAWDSHCHHLRWQQLTAADPWTLLPGFPNPLRTLYVTPH